MAAGDIHAIRAAVEITQQKMGSAAGVPEVPDTFKVVPAEAKRMSSEEARRGFSRHFEKLERRRWWRIGADPAEMRHPLREVASVVVGNVAAIRANLEGAEQSLVLATESAEFLIWAQAQAGAGCYPFPAARSASPGRAMSAAARFLERAEKNGNRGSVVRNGWVYEDLGDGGLQFDNGECGVAMFELYDLTGEKRYLDSGCRAADWASTRPLCANWNYNSFSVRLLARAHRNTGRLEYLDAAIDKARKGVLPGQITKGTYAGRWFDPHNARPAYHYIMMCALAELAAVLPPTHAHRPEIMRALLLGLKARNSEIVDRGVMNQESALEALLIVQQSFAGDAGFLTSTKTWEALRAITLLVCSEARSEKPALSPGVWGRLLEHLSQSGD